MSHLLDANALIALFWKPHEHHERVMRWFRNHGSDGWSTCALTQNAFVRVLAQPAVTGSVIAIPDIAQLLLRNIAHPKHRFLMLDFGVEQVLGACTGGLLGHRQLTDAWLLAAAIRNRARLLTLDTGSRQLLATDDERKRHLTVLT